MIFLEVNGHEPKRVAIFDTFEVQQLVVGTVRSRFDEDDRKILALCEAELNLDHPVDSVGKEHTDHQDRHRERDSNNRHHRLNWLALDMTQDHSSRLCQQPFYA